MGKKDKAKKKSQPDASSDIFKRVEEIYGTLLNVCTYVYKDQL